ncbi:trypsin-like peptidase domain-containing protein [Leptolyngbya cf. ectocarpi LEGE 11479]|uniref:Trypsin-like peptidase domain-containing protein n=1 Tax=Leptolyngbya cf. ectocarpi LEGE 11479 TaxID=1828722 RepID=A0A928ZVM4_LEPEC|nr:trypsin-like peptidase domain-containing protein [Leptolyngbya ectocarpi]MBE9068190.1 trypsin-like peptidase domain-containing protein [Leptolyngbya cf. ectocarpi LEGE 11479]
MANDGSAPEMSCKSAIARFYKGSKVIGAGILVEGDYVLTCAHVVKQALGLEKAKDPIGQELKLNFPFVSLSQRLSAKVLLYRPAKDDDTADDIAGLKLLDAAPDQVAPAKLMAGHYLGLEFGALGFPEGHPRGVYAYGILKEELPHGWVQLEDDKTQGMAIQPGFSGTAIWDQSANAMVGMVVARDKKTPEAKIGFMIPARPLLATVLDLEILGLRSVLSTYETKLTDGFATAYQLCCPEGYLEPTPADLSGKLNNLGGMKPDAKGHRAIDRFAMLLSLPALNPHTDSQKALHKWLETRVDNLQTLKDSIAPLLEKQTALESAAVESHLLIYVQPTYQQTGEYPVKAWLIPDAKHYDAKSGAGKEEIYATNTDTVTQTTLTSYVRACLENVVQRSPKDLMVHLILPLALLNEKIDTWSLMDEPILPGLTFTSTMGERYRLVVQIAERLHPKVLGFFEERWRKNWEALHTLTPTDLCDAFVAGSGDCSQGVLKGHWQMNQKLGLKLSKVLAAKQYMEVFSTLVEYGIPAALWLRCDQFANGLECGCELDGLLNCEPNKLPELVRDMRSKATSLPPDAHIGHHLSFLWEDPSLIPPRKMLGMA